MKKKKGKKEIRSFPSSEAAPDPFEPLPAGGGSELPSGRGRRGKAARGGLREAEPPSGKGREILHARRSGGFGLPSPAAQT